MKKEQRGFKTEGLIAVTVWGILLAGLIGWVANIVKLIGMDFGGVSGMLVARAIGIVVAPLGAVLGFF